MSKDGIADFGVITEDDAGLFHRVDSRGDSGRRDENALRDALDRRSCVFFQNGKDFKICLVEQIFHDRDDLRNGFSLQIDSENRCRRCIFIGKSGRKPFHFQCIYSFTLFY